MRQSEWFVLLYRSPGSTNEVPAIFFLSSFVLELWNGHFLKKIKNKRQSLKLCQYCSTEQVWGNTPLGTKTEKYQEEQTSTESVRSPSLLYNPVACAELSSFLNVINYLVCCFKGTQTNSGFSTKQTQSLGKITILLPRDMVLVSGGFKLKRGMN